MNHTATLPPPGVSVVIGNYNHAKFLPAALDRFLQLKQYFCEIIIADDCSTDDSWEVMQKYAKDNSIIRLIKNPENLGMIGNYTMLLHEAVGDYVIAASADDVMIPENLEELLLAMRKYPEAVLFAGQNNFYIEDENRLARPEKCLSVSGFCSPGLFRYFRNLPTGPCGTFIKRTLFIEYYEKCSKMYTCCDMVVSYMIMARHPFFYLKKPVATMRVAGDSRSPISFRQVDFQNKFYDQFFPFLREEYPDLYEMLVESHGFRFFPPVRRYLLTHISAWDKYTVRILWAGLTPTYSRFRYGFLPSLLPNFALKYARRVRNRIFGKPIDYPDDLDD